MIGPKRMMGMALLVTQTAIDGYSKKNISGKNVLVTFCSALARIISSMLLLAQ